MLCTKKSTMLCTMKATMLFTMKSTMLCTMKYMRKQLHNEHSLIFNSQEFKHPNWPPVTP